MNDGVNRCGDCNKPLGIPDLRGMIEAEEEYRKNFPYTWNDNDGRVLICDDCYNLMIEKEPPDE